MELPRRAFIKSSALAALSLSAPISSIPAADASILPEGAAPAPVALPHFPDRLHAFVWRNWQLVPIEKMASLLSAGAADILALGQSMGLVEPGPISLDQWSRSYLTIIRRNWHLLPYSQLLQLLDWTPEHMAFILREDDFLFIKLGSLKPKCPPLKYSPPNEAARKRAREIAAVLRDQVPETPKSSEPLFAFVRELSTPPKISRPPASQTDSIRFCYSYFALYGDPLLDEKADPYPEGYLQRLAALGVNGVWLQAVLGKLAPNPWTNEDAADREKRLENLRSLVARAARHGIGIYLYLNEPRAMPLRFFEKHPELKGVVEGDHAALCTSHPEVRHALRDAVAHIASRVSDIAGFFTITASENLTNCWSHHQGGNCPRCGKRSAAEVIAEVNTLFLEGIQRAKSKARLIAWDWGWQDAWAEEAIGRLPKEAALMSVSEWSIPIERGGVKTSVGEYSISTIGPGPRASRHWKWARERGLETLAKIQAGNTWELSAVPYIPALENVARHAASLKSAKVKGLMLGWTLGGYPSPNLEVACAINSSDSSAPPDQIVSEALSAVAARRFGSAIALAVVKAWRACSKAFSEFPYHGGVVYNAPMQFGPSNLLWAEPTGYRATMIGFPYDDLDGWRQVYPPDVFIGQFTKVAEGFEQALAELRRTLPESVPRELSREMDVMAAAAIHFRSTANQAEFVRQRETVRGEKVAEVKSAAVARLRETLLSEIALARELYDIQKRDSRIGFEASNQYYYVPGDLLEKIVNCRHLLESWLPSLES